MQWNVQQYDVCGYLLNEYKFNELKLTKSQLDNEV